MSGERCPGSAEHLGWNMPRSGPDIAPCPVCGRKTSVHRVTGRFARHNLLTDGET